MKRDHHGRQLENGSRPALRARTNIVSDCKTEIIAGFTGWVIAQRQHALADLVAVTPGQILQSGTIAGEIKKEEFIGIADMRSVVASSVDQS